MTFILNNFHRKVNLILPIEGSVNSGGVLHKRTISGSNYKCEQKKTQITNKYIIKIKKNE